MAAPLAVVDMLDATGVDASRIPRGTKRVAIYLTGSGGIAWTNGDVATLTHEDPELQTVLRIDQSNTLALSSLAVYLIKDIEAGAASVGTAVQEAQKRRQRGLRTGFYFSRADWDAVVNAISAVPGLVDWVDFWVADWNLDRAGAIAFMETDKRIKAVQYQSDHYFDRSVTRADWPLPMPARKPSKAPVKAVKKAAKKVKSTAHPKVTVGGISGVLTAALLLFLNSHGVHVTHLNNGQSDAITLAATVLAGLATPSKN